MNTLFNVNNIPIASGIGLRDEHYQDVIDGKPDIGWFEVHAENYMEDGGAPHYYLSTIREDYPLSIHGVGLSIGSYQGLDQEHLNGLRKLINRYEPGLFSEHLAWTGIDGVHYNDLLPIPYNQETLNRVCEHIDQLQNTVKRKVLIENPATYVQYDNSDITEPEFLSLMVHNTGCGLLLDVNNVYVAATNHNYSPKNYIDQFPIEAVFEIHLGGHTIDVSDNGGRLLIDSHNRKVSKDVWELYDHSLVKIGAVPTLIEWDGDIPEFTELLSEAKKSNAIIEKYLCNNSAIVSNKK